MFYLGTDRNLIAPPNTQSARPRGPRGSRGDPRTVLFPSHCQARSCRAGSALSFARTTTSTLPSLRFSCGPSAVSQSVSASARVGEKPVLGKQSGLEEPPCERTALLALPIPPPPMNLRAFGSGPSERDSAAVALPILHADVHLQSLQRGGLNAHQTQSVCTDLLGFILLFSLSLFFSTVVQWKFSS